MPKLFMAVLLVGLGGAAAQGPTKVEAVYFSAEDFPAGKPVTKRPYSADRLTETVAFRFSSSSLAGREYRDSAGRTRSETVSLNSGTDPVYVTIVDPIARVRYVLDVGSKIAHRQTLTRRPKNQPAPGYSSCPGPAVDTNYLQPVCRECISASVAFPRDSWCPAFNDRNEQKLGKQTMEGFQAEGIRQNLEGEEIWRSPKWKLTLRSTKRVLATKITERLTRIDLTEPDPSLFQPPPDYRLVDEPADFRIFIPVR